MFLSGHCCDEGRTLPTAFLRWQEGDGTLGSQTPHRLLQNSGETRIKKITMFRIKNETKMSSVKQNKTKKIIYIASVSEKGCLLNYSLRMQLVEGSVHPHGDGQTLQSSVLSDLIDHGRHPCAAQLSCTP